MNRQTKCGNCDHKTTEANIRPLYELPNLFARLDPGSEVPIGECIECGAFTYLVRTPSHIDPRDIILPPFWHSLVYSLSAVIVGVILVSILIALL